MIDSAQFVSILLNQGFNFFTGVPCSFFKSAINAVIADSKAEYRIAPNEGSALAMAAGASTAGRQSVVLIQNSGFGNLINPLTSLNMIYAIPTLIFMSGRAYGVADEPQHEIIGAHMEDMLKAMGCAYAVMPQESEEFKRALVQASATMKQTRKPFFFLVKKGTLSQFDNPPAKPAYPMTRIEAIQIFSDSIAPEDFVVATTGMISRELFAVKDRPRNFYMQGSMGHAPSIGLGWALSRPEVKVWVLDGDGALLMHLGVLPTIGHYAPQNFYHAVLDNESYESTGDQDTVSPTTDLCAIAKASGYRDQTEVKDPAAFKQAIQTLAARPGPQFMRVKINRTTTGGDTPRISSRYESPQITDQILAQFKL